MTSQGAERTVTISALVVAGIYTYRRMTEGSGAPTSGKLAQLAGKGSPPSVGMFITAWGTAFMIISIVASAAPSLGGSLALLVAVGDALSNTTQVAKDINTKIGAGSSSAKPQKTIAAGPQATSQTAAGTKAAGNTITVTTKGLGGF